MVVVGFAVAAAAVVADVTAVVVFVEHLNTHGEEMKGRDGVEFSGWVRLPWVLRMVR